MVGRGVTGMVSSAVLFVLPSFACQGMIGDPLDGPRKGEERPANEEAALPEPLETAPSDDAADPSPLRRLTEEQYRNTVRDVLGTEVGTELLLPRDVFVQGFDAAAFAQTVTRADAELYLESAAAVAALVDLDSLAGCSLEEEACRAGFLSNVGSALYRRPIKPAEVAFLDALYATARAAADPVEAARAMLEAMLAAPDFLYRVEVGDLGARLDDRVPLTGHEIAARLSYFFWDRVPDAELLEAAGSGSLATVEGIRAQVDRMLDDPRTRRKVRRFHRQWLGLDRLFTVNPDPVTVGDLGEALRQDMIEESERFAEHVVFDAPDGSFEALLTAPYTFVNGRLAEHYGLAASSEELERVDLDPAVRGGILTQGALMASLANEQRAQPIWRGHFVLTQILCREIELPDSLNVVLPEPSADSSFRERIEVLTSPAFCHSCHGRINPPGFALDAFDALGRFIERDPHADLPLDTTGELEGVGSASGSFDGAMQLMQNLAGSDEARACYADRWFLVAFGRGRKTEVDDVARDALADAFRASGYRIEALLRAIPETDLFRFRFVDEQEGAP